MSYYIKQLAKLYPEEKTPAARIQRREQELLALCKAGDEDAVWELLNKLRRACDDLHNTTLLEKDMKQLTGDLYKSFKTFEVFHIKHVGNQYVRRKQKRKAIDDKVRPSDYLTGLIEDKDGFTVSECIHSFLEEHPEMSERRAREYQLLVQPRGIAEPIKDRAIIRLRARDLEIIRLIGLNNKLSRHTINYKVSILFYLFVWAKEQSLIDTVPWEGIPPLRTRQRGKIRRLQLWGLYPPKTSKEE